MKYGNHTCHLCGGGKDKNHILEESATSADHARIVIKALMKATEKDAYQSLSGNRRKDRFMIGVLVCASGKTVVSASYQDSPAESFRKAMTWLPGYHLCGAVQRPLLSRGGSEIETSMITSCEVSNSPLCCAAPKLIDYANRNGFKTPYSMSEVFFDPNQERRRLAGKNVRTTHGETIPSCETCQKIVPMMMCELSGAVRTDDTLTIPIPPTAGGS